MYCSAAALQSAYMKKLERYSKNIFLWLRFDRRDEAQQAINSLNGVIPENGTEPLVVKIAEEHGKQKAAYYAGWQAGYNQSRGKYTASFFICLLNPLLFPAFMSHVFVVLSVSCLNIHSYISLLVTCASICLALMFKLGTLFFLPFSLSVLM